MGQGKTFSFTFLRDQFSTATSCMLLITNANILAPDQIIKNGAVCIDGNIISEIGSSTALEKKYPKARRLDAQGGLCMPGLANCHMHFYSTFARGMNLGGVPPKNFKEILKRLWWRLDKALTKEDVYYSAMVPLIECVRSGTTCVIDHHASPLCVLGSLNTIKGALSKIPVRASLCYEVSDRDGAEIARQGIEENAQFIKGHGGSHMLQGLFGLHASFTLSDRTLKRCAAVVHDFKTSIHVHTAEGVADADHCRQNHSCGVVERWRQFNLLGPRAILAHCIHIDHKEMQIIKYAGLKKAQRLHKIKKDETVVVLITGTGLKDIPTAMKAITIPAAVEVKIKR
ncbi:MAG: amidohydrolase family protein [Deltaproteobacteria bacterium]|nr:amidohydrolase family protein [Deltaproteobacteria bacterium]